MTAKNIPVYNRRSGGAIIHYPEQRISRVATAIAPRAYIRLSSMHANSFESELLMLYKIGIAMQSTLRLDEIFYVILTCVTAHEGLGFNRAMIFLVDEKNNVLEGRMGIGPDSDEDAQRIWNYIQHESKNLEQLLACHKDFGRRDDSHFNALVKSIRLPIKRSSGILAKTVLDKRSFEIISPDALAALKKSDPVRALFNMNCFISVPLIARNHVLGVMIVDNYFSADPITTEHTWRLSMFATQAALAIENSQEFERTLFLANTDRLTGLWNYGHFQHQLSEEIKRAARFNRPLSLLLLDVDYFKQFNDTHGHVSGDRVLQELAVILKKTSRDVDLVARYGGEEFAIILPETVKDKAHASAERVRRAVAEHCFTGEAQSAGLHLTVSVGIANMPQDASSAALLVTYADRALYTAKHVGRNRVCMFSQEIL